MALLAADPRGLVAAERRRRVATAPGVDIDASRLEHRRELVGVRDVPRPQARPPGRTPCRWRARQPLPARRTASRPARARRSPHARSSSRPRLR